jgi:hypothetical protein
MAKYDTNLEVQPKFPKLLEECFWMEKCFEEIQILLSKFSCLDD